MQKIYLISSKNGYVKIGIAKNPEKRLKQLQTGNAEILTIEYIVDVMVNTAKLVESMIHHNLKDYKKSGEWFDVSINRAKSEIDFAIIRYDNDSFTSLHKKNGLIY